MQKRRRIGVLGYGALGKYLVQQIFNDGVVSEKVELAFVWNRTVEAVLQDSSVPRTAILENIEDFKKFNADLVVEVAHPAITKSYGHLFLEAGCDYFCGSPTAFADAETESQLRAIATRCKTNGLYLPVGALWGAEDIQRMATRGTLVGLQITMKFHPHSLKLLAELATKLEEVKGKPGEHRLYEGPVRALCLLAPNNTNTMACAAMAGFNLGFDQTKAVLIADESLDAHIIEIDVEGPSRGDLGKFSVKTVRHNPALPGAVTGHQTFVSFLNSMLSATKQQGGFHFC